MSEMELHKGTAVLVVKDERETLESICQRLCEKEGYKLDKFYDNYTDLLREDGYRKYIIVDDKVFMLNDEELGCDGDINVFTKNEDGSISYITQFYNGGASFSEVIEDGISEVITDD